MRKLLFCVLLSTPLLSFGQSGTISGVITYFFNDFVDRPDVGSRVFVFEEKIIPPGVYEYSTLDTFRVVNSYRELQQIYKIISQEMSEREKEPMKTCGIKTEEDFEDLDRRAFTIIRKIKSQSELKTTVDVNGNFAITVPPGEYSILIISSHRKGLSLSEVMGKFYHARLKVKAGGRADFSRNFQL